MFETLIFAIILILLNLILVYKPMPILGLIIGLFTIIISLGVFISDTDLPANTPTPYFTLVIILMSIANLLSQALDMKK